jgi:hypothetical protein
VTRRLRVHVTSSEAKQIRIGWQRASGFDELPAVGASEVKTVEVQLEVLRDTLGRELVGRLILDAMSSRGLDSVNLHIHVDRDAIADEERLEVLED